LLLLFKKGIRLSLMVPEAGLEPSITGFCLECSTSVPPLQAIDFQRLIAYQKKTLFIVIFPAIL
jgi:hypothetical protein